jgi:TetR/AcrR family transcriptional regulator, cholesterol catabolism regulator
MNSITEKETDIIAQSAELFLRYGVKSITMDDLSRHLAISKKTLYQFFTDKTDLVNKTIKHIIKSRSCEISKICDLRLNAIEELFKVYQHANELIRNHNPMLEFDLQRFYPSIYRDTRETHRKAIYETTLSNLMKGKQEGFYRADLNEVVITKLHVLRIENFTHSDFLTTEEIHSNEFLNEVFKYHLYGIVSSKGIKYIKNHYPEFIHP